MIKVISFDIFQTLVDVNLRIPQIWQGILDDSYTKEKGEYAAKAILSCYPDAIKVAVDSRDYFYTMDEVYMMCAVKALKILQYPVSAREVVDNLLLQHSKAPFYKDALPCIQRLKENYKVILSSDSNHLMVDELIKVICPDKAFISDDLHSYKASKDEKFFEQVLKEMAISPNEMIHIGDSSHDIIGAKRAGIPCVWLNRDNRDWSNKYKPDITVHSLKKLDQVITQFN